MATTVGLEGMNIAKDITDVNVPCRSSCYLSTQFNWKFKVVQNGKNIIRRQR